MISSWLVSISSDWFRPTIELELYARKKERSASGECHDSCESRMHSTICPATSYFVRNSCLVGRGSSERRVAEQLSLEYR